MRSRSFVANLRANVYEVRVAVVIHESGLFLTTAVDLNGWRMNAPKRFQEPFGKYKKVYRRKLKRASR